MLILIPDPIKQRFYKLYIAQFYPLYLLLNHIRSSPYFLYLPSYPIRSCSTCGILIDINIIINIIICFIDPSYLFRSITCDHIRIIEYRLHGF